MPPRYTGTDFAGFDSEDAGHVNNVASIKGVGATAITFAQDRGISAALLSQAGHQLNFGAAMRGFETFAFNNAVRRYERTGDIDVLQGHTGTTDAGVALRSNYSFGDEAAVDQAWRIADGTDLLRVDVEPARRICRYDRGKPVRVGHGATSKDATCGVPTYDSPPPATPENAPPFGR